MEASLRDRFAAQIAAALVHRSENAEEVAQRAYDIADALMRERERRRDHLAAETLVALEALPEPFREYTAGFDAVHLLDEPAPPPERDDDELHELMARAEDRTFNLHDQDPPWRAMFSSEGEPLGLDPDAEVPASPRPGLRRTTPAEIKTAESTGKKGRVA